jgi:hypothetical protein
MEFWLYFTIWTALACLAAAELARRPRPGRAAGTRGAWTVSAAGLAACVVHIAIAMIHRHGGSHAAAILETARQTEAVYGVAWGGGVYVNYAFVALWAADLWRWRRRPLAPWPRAARWALRVFVLVIVFNAAVVFARKGWPLGIVLTTALAWAWRGGRKATETQSSRS